MPGWYGSFEKKKGGTKYKRGFPLGKPLQHTYKSTLNYTNTVHTPAVPGSLFFQSRNC